MHAHSPDHHLPQLLLECIENQLLPELVVRSLDPHDPVRLLNLPRPWTTLGCGNYAAVLLHPERVVKVDAPDRLGLAQEVEVYRRIGSHPAFSQCFHAGDG